MIERVRVGIKRYVDIIKTINGFSSKYIFITICSQVFTIINSYLLLYINKIIINGLSNIIMSGEISVLSIIALLAVCGIIEILSMLLFNVLQYNLGKLKLKYDDEISLKMACSFSKLDMSYYDDPVAFNQTQQAGKCKSSILDSYNGLLDLVFGCISFIIAFIVAVRFSILVFILSVLSVIPGLIIRKRLQIEHYEIEKELLNKQRQVNNLVGMFYNKNVEMEMQVYSFSNYIKEKIEKYQLEIRNVRIKQSLKKARKEGALSILSKTFHIVQQVIVVYIISGRNMTIGDFTYYGGIINNLSSSLNGIAKTVNTLHLNSVKYDEYISIMSRKPKLKSIDNKIVTNDDMNVITFEKVSFCYPNTDKKVLTDISFSIKSGEKFALVGQNGAGKSTLIKLLLRFYDPTEGKILLNGVNIQEYDLEVYRKLFSTMFQEPLVYLLSVKENVAISDTTCSSGLINDRVEKILTDLKLKQMNGDLLDIDKYCGKDFYADGYVFSVGQKQRIHAARTLFHEGAIYVLDEPAASMDAISEAEFLNTLVEYTHGKSVIYITHRYNNLDMMDNILVLDHGAIVEFGKHNDLISHNGIYSRMFEIQNKKA